MFLPVNFKKKIALVLSSGIFFLGSCSGGVIGGMEMFSRFKARNIENGDAPTPHIVILAIKKKAAPQIVAIDVEKIINFEKENNDFTYLLPKDKDAIIINDLERIDYQTTSLSPEKQRVEVKYTNGNNWRNGYFFSRYYAENKKVTLIYSRAKTFDYMFAALPFAFCLSIVLNIIGKHIKRPHKL